MKTICTRTTIISIVVCSFMLSASLNTSGQGLQAVQLSDFKAESKNGNVGLSWKTSSEKDLRQFEVEYSEDGKYYHNLGFIPATNTINGNFYEFEHPVSYTDSAFYRLKIVDRNGSWLYTKPVLYSINNTTALFVYPSVISSRIINIFLKDPFNSLEIVSMNGTVMLRQNLSGETGRINIPVSPTLASGMYIVQLDTYGKTITQKVMIQ